MKTEYFKKENGVLIILLVVSALFRFWHFSEWSLTNDELSAITRLKYSSFSEMIEKGVRTNDMHPMGVQSFLWMWTHMFGSDEFWIRLPFVLFGIGSVFMFYNVGKNFFGVFPALMATAVIGGLDFFILYSQLARPYSPGLFFCLCFLYTWTNWMWHPEKNTAINRVLFIVAGAACMYMHYFSFLFAAIVGLTGLVLLDRKERGHYLLAGTLMLVLYIPNAEVFFTHFSVGGLGGPDGWLGAPAKTAILDYVIYGFNSDKLFCIVVLAIAILGVFLNKEKLKWSLRHSLALFFFLSPALIAYYYSVSKNPIFQFSILLFSFPLLVLFLFSFFNPELSKTRFWHLPFILLFITYFSSVADGSRYSQQFAPFKDIASKCAEYNKLYADKGVIASVNVIHPYYMEYYANRLPDFPAVIQSACVTPDHFLALKKSVDSLNGDVFIHAWANTYHSPEVEMVIQSKFPFIVNRDSFFNAGVMVFSKKIEMRNDQVSGTVFEDVNNAEGNHWQNDSLVRTTEYAFSGSYSLSIKNEQEFSPGIKVKASSIGLATGAVYKLSCMFRSDSALNEAKGVVSVDRDGKNIVWRGIGLKEFAVNTEWNLFYAGYEIQEEIRPDDIVSVYFYNPSREKFWLDDIRFTVEAR